MSEQLKTVAEVFTETWKLYQRRALPILAVISLTTAVVVVLMVAVGVLLVLWAGDAAAIYEKLTSGVSREILAVIALPVALMLLLVISWSQAAAVAASIDDRLSVIDALRAGCKFCFPMALIASLYIGIVMTGFGLLVVPGVVVLVSMAFCFYVMVDEGVTGLNALLRSRRYVFGHWRDTFVKLSLVWLLSIIISLLPVAGQLLSFLFTPYLMLFMAVVYYDLKANCLGDDIVPDRGALWSIMAVVGVVVPLLGIVGAMITFWPRLPDYLQQCKDGSLPGLKAFSGLLKDVSQDKDVSVTPSVRRLPSVDGAWVWHDPIGDARIPALDIGQVAVKGEDGELLVRVRTAAAYDSFFVRARPDIPVSLLSVYIDTDVDRQTGASASEVVTRSGYDKRIDVVLAVQAGQTGQALVNVSSLSGRHEAVLGSIDAHHVDMVDNFLRFRVPYSLLRIEAGKTIRVCFREFAQQQASGLSKDKLVSLQ